MFVLNIFIKLYQESRVNDPRKDRIFYFEVTVNTIAAAGDINELKQFIEYYKNEEVTKNESITTTV